jgi:predicted MarR family transcription regulator
MESSHGTIGTRPPVPPDSGEAAAPCQDRYMSFDALAASLTRFEMGIMRLYEAFSSWALELQKYVSGYQLSFQECALLHCVRLRGGSTTLAEMMMFLHRHDLAAINYSLRKLEQHGLIKRMKGPFRREVAYAITDSGRAITDAYGRMRHQVLVKLCREVLGMQASTADAAAVMERMIGIYDQASQSILNQSLISTASMLPASGADRGADTDVEAVAGAGADAARTDAASTPRSAKPRTAAPAVRRTARRRKSPR